mgnify:CR=1 FL=1
MEWLFGVLGGEQGEFDDLFYCFVSMPSCHQYIIIDFEIVKLSMRPIDQVVPEVTARPGADGPTGIVFTEPCSDV